MFLEGKEWVPVCEAESGATAGALRTEPRCGPYAADAALARRLAERPQRRLGSSGADRGR